jgi:hypothetical protein
MKRTLRLFAIPILAVFALLATSYQPPRSVAAPRACAPIVNGHNVSGQLPTASCPDDGLPILDPNYHAYSNVDACPIDGQPLARSHLNF